MCGRCHRADCPSFRISYRGVQRGRSSPTPIVQALRFAVNRASCLTINVTEQRIVASETMLPEEYMRRSSVKEYTETMRRHYTGASRTEKSRLLDEFTRVTGYHRKSPVRL